MKRLLLLGIVTIALFSLLSCEKSLLDNATNPMTLETRDITVSLSDEFKEATRSQTRVSCEDTLLWEEVLEIKEKKVQSKDKELPVDKTVKFEITLFNAEGDTVYYGIVETELAGGNRTINISIINPVEEIVIVDTVYIIDTVYIDTGDTGAIDTGSIDTGSIDTGSIDTGSIDTGSIDTGSIDTGSIDTGVVNLGPIAHWTFDGHYNDISGNDHHGTPTNVEFTQDRFGKNSSAALFTGTLTYYNYGIESYVAAQDHEDLDFDDTKAFTFSVWVKGNPVQEQEGAGIVTKGIGHHQEAYVLDVFYNRYRFMLNTQSGSTYRIDTDISPSNSWEHLAGVYDGEKQLMTLYLNGAIVGQSSAPTTLMNSAEPVAIGSRKKVTYKGYNLNFDGALDDVILYDRAFSDLEIKDLYNSSKPAN